MMLFDLMVDKGGFKFDVVKCILILSVFNIVVYEEIGIFNKWKMVL